MSKKPRIGSDPLRWIKDTATHEPEPDSPALGTAEEEDEGVLGTIPKVPADKAPQPAASGMGKLSKQSKPRILDKLDKPDKSDKQRGAGKPSPSKEISTSRTGLGEAWTRATLIARLDYLEKIKALAYFDRRQLKDVVDEILGGYLKRRAADLEQAEALYKQRRVV